MARLAATQLGSLERKMRILILDLKWSYGIEEITAILYEELGKRCDVAVISATESRLPYSEKVARSETNASMLLAFINPFVHARIIRHLMRIRPDVLYIISPHFLNAAVGAYCRLFTDIVIVTHIHDPAHYGKKLVSSLVNSLSFIQCRLSHRIYCWGETIKRAICEKFRVSEARVAVFRHGPGQTTFYDKHLSSERRGLPHHFSMVGALQKRKGIEYFLKAAILFNQQHGSDHAGFLLAGAGRLNEYRELMLQIPNLILRNTFVGNDEVNEILGQSYALVLPYVGGVLQSSFIAIAYGNGCPVIVSNIGSLPEEVENGRTGFIVEKANAEQIAAAMTKIYTEGEKANLSENCIRVYKEKFSWDRIGEQMFRDMMLAADGRRKKKALEKVGQAVEAPRKSA